MKGLVPFMQSVTGRSLRAILGLALIIGGIFGIPGTAGWIVAVIGLIPLFAGVFGVCFFAPLLGYTLTGQRRAVS